MSVASKNPFAVLDDDPEEATTTPAIPSTAVKEVVKKSTSSKKSDAAPKADPSKATGKRGPTGNEGAFRDKSVGRDANRQREAPKAGEKRGPKPGRAFDRHSQTGKTDTDKKVKKGWGDNKKKLDDEAAGETIARDDETKDEAETSEDTPMAEEEEKTKTLDEYFAELNTKSEEIKTSRSARRVNEGTNDPEWENASELVREQEEFVQGSNQKSLRQKNRKEKTVLETEINFVSSAQESRRPRSDGPRRGGRGGRNGPREGREGREVRGGRGGRGSRPARADRNVPAVNISNSDEFPTLGA